MIKKVEKVLAKLPFNGDLTIISTALVTISRQPELLAIPQLAGPLAVVGTWGMFLGLVRKAVKLFSKSKQP